MEPEKTSISFRDLDTLLAATPTATNGDRMALRGFIVGEKPGSHLPAKVSDERAEVFLHELRKHVPDARRYHAQGDGPFLVYSPQKITERISREPEACEQLGIKDDSAEEILRKTESSSLVEGFVLGFPLPALRTWERLTEIHSKAPSFARLINDDSIFSGWDPADVSKLQVLRTRISTSVSRENTIWDFFKQPNIKPFIESLYRKYSALSEEEISFLFSIKRVATEGMNYLISSTIEDQKNLVNKAVHQTLE